jgi:hypothetical protein
MVHLASRCALVAFVLTSTGISSALADEGMWLFNNPPLKQFKEKYQFEPTPQWLEHLQKSSVRFNSGGSGSFVSATGLVITNHHVGLDTLQKVSSEKINYVHDGFYAKTQKDEIKATDLELNVLMSIQDVTDRVKSAVRPEMSADDAGKARRAAIAAIEKESKDSTGLRSDVVTLYQGGVYNLYRYKRYDDVRIVFAPEQQAAFYGGDPDNFEYPRYDLDICIFRAYENGQPAKPEHFLKWNTKGPSDGELTFVSGHPGKTDRQLTTDELADMPIEEFREKESATHYIQPAIDGSRPGHVMVNTGDFANRTRLDVETTAYHEGVPGHHMQIAIALERKSIHPIGRYLGNSGYTEGWALYAERLADEMKLFSGDLDRLGMLSSQALRASRLVVDSGVHTLGWTRQQAIDFMLAHTAEDHADVVSEVDRYIIYPGQATAYMLGRLEISQAREEAKARMGEKFDIKAFHDRVLEDGAIPVSFLHDKIRAWAAQ